MDVVLLRQEYMLLRDFNFDLLKQNKHWLEKNYPLQPHTVFYLHNNNHQYNPNIMTTSTSATEAALSKYVYHLLAAATISPCA